MDSNIPDEPQPIEEYELVDENKLSSSFMTKFLAFMAIELVIAVFAIGYFMNGAPWAPNSHTGSAPVETYDPSAMVKDLKSAKNPATVKQNAGVLGVSTNEESPKASATPKIIYQIITPLPSPSVIPKNKTYTIALVGDSMEQTMGPTAEFLQKSLKTLYPDTGFLIYNYGLSATNVKDGLDRFDNEFKADIRNYPSIPTLKPDFIVIGSFAYNPFSPHNRDAHWITLTQLVEKAKKVSPNMYLLAEIAPLRAGFGKGPTGMNWDTATNVEHSSHIIDLLENTVGLSKTLGVPLIDAYTPSLLKSKYGKEGDTKYVSVNDGIHPSLEGHEFIADLIAKKLRF